MKNMLIKIIRNSDYPDELKQKLIHYLLLLEDSALLLEALEMNGVENWTWYDQAIDDYNEWKNKGITVEEL